ncbi:MAG: LuxR C-terminal-related transcriptional regulator [Oscillospiraceae bacterium]|nr:LuxR C-terminal-related transcriptional regulator [Oscillospiraceae bacterium]
MADNPNEINLYNSLFTENYVPRHRIDRLFDRLIRRKLVYVIAGAGYGKTQAVYHYIKQQTDVVVRWLQLTENDNIGFHYWESITYNISLDNPELAAKLREFGFPETLARFKQFAEILKSTRRHSNKTFIILDDFHVIYSKQALIFAERCAYLEIPGICMIIISRQEPEINAVSLFSRGKAGIVTEDELRFTEKEIADFLKQRGIPFAAKNLPQFIGATKGWVLAINLLSLVLKKIPNNLNHALETMKQNIFKLLETEAFNDFPESVQKNLVKLSLVSSVPLTPLHEIFGDASFIQRTPQLTSFMWFDSFIGDYRIHPLYLEFLQSKQHVFSYEEKQDTYRWAAQWCSENNFYMNAIKYYAKSRQFERMLEVFLSYPFKMPYDACEYFLNILEKLDPDNKEKNNRSVLLLKNYFIPIFLIGMGRFEDAREFSLNVIRKWEISDTPFSLYLLYITYSTLAYIDTYICTITHKYDSPMYTKKAAEYFKLSSSSPVKITGAYTVADVRSFACVVGEGAERSEFDKFLDAARETAVNIAETYHNMYCGYEDLVACEFAFIKNQLDTARSYAHGAILKAREKKQYSIEAMTEQYLFRIAIYEGDYSLTKEILKQLREHLDNPDFWSRQLLYDLFTGLFYVQTGLPEMVPSWLVMDEKETTSEVRIPIRELIVSVKYYIASQKYTQALAVLCNSYPREPHERFLFGELTLSLLTAVAQFKTGDITEAMKSFQKAYQLSFQGEFEMPFIELGKNIHLLTVAASNQPGCVIPEEWLKTIERKASIYSKKTAFIRNSFKKDKNMKDNIQLSEREQEVLNDLYHGLSREEIAANRYLSINTVKKILQSIYIKLDANNNVDAIRIAIEKKLVE